MGQNLACTLLPYLQTFLYTQRTPNFIKIKVFDGLLGVIRMHNPVNRAPYSYHGEYSAIFTMVKTAGLLGSFCAPD